MQMEQRRNSRIRFWGSICFLFAGSDMRTPSFPGNSTKGHLKKLIGKPVRTDGNGGIPQFTGDNITLPGSG
jgi:hypothetical protein